MAYCSYTAAKIIASQLASRLACRKILEVVSKFPNCKLCIQLVNSLATLVSFLSWRLPTLDSYNEGINYMTKICRRKQCLIPQHVLLYVYWWRVAILDQLQFKSCLSCFTLSCLTHIAYVLIYSFDALSDSIQCHFSNIPLPFVVFGKTAKVNGLNYFQYFIFISRDKIAHKFQYWVWSATRGGLW